jgi:hypothetical protein
MHHSLVMATLLSTSLPTALALMSFVAASTLKPWHDAA